MNKRLFDARPIGLFDSGVGGLTVLGEVARRFPNESFIYLGDTARVPYGSKSARTVERYTIQVADFLIRKEVKALVVACNTASALGLAALRAYTKLPLLGVIQPGCKAAVRLTQKGRIGVIGTRSTVASGAYPHTISLLEPALQVISLACPMFVPLVEEGWTHHPAARLIVEESLRTLKDEEIDTLIMGCTHYPLLRQMIGEVLGPSIRLVDSAAAVADELGERLAQVVAPAPADAKQRLDYLVTDVADRFREVALRFLDGLPVERVEMIDL